MLPAVSLIRALGAACRTSSRPDVSRLPWYRLRVRGTELELSFLASHPGPDILDAGFGGFECADLQAAVQNKGAKRCIIDLAGGCRGRVRLLGIGGRRFSRRRQIAVQVDGIQGQGKGNIGFCKILGAGGKFKFTVIQFQDPFRDGDVLRAAFDAGFQGYLIERLRIRGLNRKVAAQGGRQLPRRKRGRWSSTGPDRAWRPDR